MRKPLTHSRGMDTITAKTKPAPHALFNKTVVRNESTGRLAAILSALDRELQPVGIMEQIFVENMAMARWRQVRMREVAAHLREASDRDEAPARYQSLTERTERLENLGRMERRAVRMYNSSFKAFKEYRVDRRREQ